MSKAAHVNKSTEKQLVLLFEGIFVLHQIGQKENMIGPLFSSSGAKY